MQTYLLANRLWISAAALSMLCMCCSIASAQTSSCPDSASGLTLPAGFCASIFADGIGHARHLVVAPNGVVYVNTWSGRYYGNDTPHAMLMYPSLDLPMTEQIRRNDFDYTMISIKEGHHQPHGMSVAPASIAAAAVGDTGSAVA